MRKFLGNIVTNGNPDVDRDAFNVVKSIDESVEGIPTLVVGLENARKTIPDFNILNKCYGELSWTYSKTEHRCDYEDDLEGFVDMCVRKAVEGVKYTYIDFISYKRGTIRKILAFAKGPSKKTVFLTRGSSFMFVYSETYKTVFGVSLSLCEYIGIPKKKVIRLVRNAEFVHDTKSLDGLFRRAIGNDTHLVPVIWGEFGLDCA